MFFSKEGGFPYTQSVSSLNKSLSTKTRSINTRRQLRKGRVKGREVCRFGCEPKVRVPTRGRSTGKEREECVGGRTATFKLQERDQKSGR